jgi:hypothetical protein
MDARQRPRDRCWQAGKTEEHGRQEERRDHDMVENPVRPGVDKNAIEHHTRAIGPESPMLAVFVLRQSAEEPQRAAIESASSHSAAVAFQQ